MVAAGDVALMAFPFHEHEAVAFKRRPVLILATHGVGIDGAVWVMMITSNARRFAHPSATDIPLRDWRAVPLAAESVLRTTRVWTAEQRDVIRRLGGVAPGILEQAREAVRAAPA